MAIELKVPAVGESITEAMIGEWLKQEGDEVAIDEPLVVIETDKVTVELPAPQAGVIEKILKRDGEDAEIGEVIGYLRPAGEDEAAKKEPEPTAVTTDEPSAKKAEGASPKPAKKAEKKPAKPAAKKAADEPDAAAEEPEKKDTADEPRVMPAARRMLEEAGLDASEVEASGPGGRLLKEDVVRHLEAKGKVEDEAPADAPAPAQAAPAQPRAAQPSPAADASTGGYRQEEAVKMSPLRRRVASRLVEAQQTAALLTTFNEIDMSGVMELRKRFQERFVERHGIKLGFMSFFVKAAVEALKEVPSVNAELRDQEIVYRNYADIGIAVGGGKGLVVPVIRNAERLSFAEVEKTIADYARRAQENKLKLEELQGGTFTISNGGIYGSLLSTPIVNPPQSGILGMHAIQERPVARDGEVVIRPMMYVALTYDHRLIDGREAVTFLIRLKERVEDPTRILIEA